MRAKRRSENPNIRQYEFLGFVANGTSGNQVYGTCLLCDRLNKMYVNRENGLWDCKVCGEHGNIYSMMKKYTDMLREAYSGETGAWEALEQDRAIPYSVLQEAGIVYDPLGDKYVIPVYRYNVGEHRNLKESIANLRFYRLGTNGAKYPTIGMPGLSSCLYTLQTRTAKTRRVYVCEGEWDTIALTTMLKQAEVEDAIAGGVPGAEIFKEEWMNFFIGIENYLCYDNDEAGRKGTVKIASHLLALTNMKNRVFSIQWPDYVSEGFDVRDSFRNHWGIEDIDYCVVPYDLKKEMQELGLEATNGKHSSSSVVAKDFGGSIVVRGDSGVIDFNALNLPEKTPTFEDTIEVFRKWIYIADNQITTLRICFATYLTQAIAGDPLWVFLVGPSGAGKTLALKSMISSVRSVYRSQITAKSLISGMGVGNKSNKKMGEYRVEEDPSLIPKLDGKVFILKDFTEILSARKDEKDSVFGILRGVFDGDTRRNWGQGKEIVYVSHFNMLAGVTKTIHADRTASLGERFLMYNIHLDKGFTNRDMIAIALEDSGKNLEMEAELGEATRLYLDGTLRDTPLTTFPVLSEEWRERIINLAQFVAVMRCNVVRTLKDKLSYDPEAEVGTRIGIQLQKLARGLIFTEPTKEMNENVYAILKQVALDTCIEYYIKTVEAIATHGPMDVIDLMNTTHIPRNTLNDYLEDMKLLGIFEREVFHAGEAARPPMIYTLTDYIKGFMLGAKLDYPGIRIKVKDSTSAQKRRVRLVPHDYSR